MNRDIRIEEAYKAWIWAFIFAFIYVYAIPWTELWGKEFEDTANYLFRIKYLQEGGTEAHYTGLKWILDEPLWRYIILALGFSFDDYRLSIYLISFLALLFSGSFFFRRVEFYVVMLLLLNPMSVNLYIEQVRIALAFSLVLFAYDLSSKAWASFFLLLAFLIHASMPIFLGLYYILHYFNKNVEARKYYLIAIFTALGMALFMKFGANAILSAAGDRHAGYGDVAGSSSLAYSMAWFIIAIILSVFADFRTDKERILIAYAIVFMSFFFFSSILGIYAQRYVAVIMPIIIIAIGHLPRHIKQATYLFMFAYNLFMFKYWLQLSVL